MRPIPLLAALLCLATPTFAETLSEELGANGITATAARLNSATTPEDLFALGALRFLGAVEAGLQARWKMGVSDSMMILPVMRLPIPENSTPQVFDPAMISAIFADLSARMDAARVPLAQIPADAEFGVVIALNDIWFDINANTTRDAGEDAGAVLGPMLMGWQWDERDQATPLPTVRFDAADAAWLMAYTHLLQGTGNIVLAYDPTAAITRMIETRAVLNLVPRPAYVGYFDAAPFADVFSVIDGALDQQPDPTLMKAAHTHFLSMIAENRRFWPLVNAEADNTMEWVPNDRQQSALGITLPPGTGDVWLAVLTDAEALLQGTALIPYWRTGEGHGVNLARMFTDPTPVDMIGWFQGYAAVPYLEQGRTISDQNWLAFEQMMSGDALLFTLFLN